MIRRFRWSASERAIVRDGLGPVLRRDAAFVRAGRFDDGTLAPADVVETFAKVLPRGRAVLKALRAGREIELSPICIGWLLTALDEAERDGAADRDTIAALRVRLRAIDITTPQGTA